MIVVAPNPEHYEQQFQEKYQRLQTRLTPWHAPTLEGFRSPPLHYRQRAEFKFWHQGEQSHYAVFDQGPGQPPSCITEFPVAAANINRLMPLLRNAITANPLLRRKLFQVEFLTTQAGDNLVTLVYHKPLDDDWITQARQLAADLNIQLIGRSRKQKWVLDRDYVVETFTVGQQTFRYRQLEGCFSQPNAAICEQMLNWASEVASDTQGDLLELYCGNGNFTLPLAQHFRKVLATEISKPLTAAAQQNCVDNNIGNIEFARLSAEDMSAALNGVREFRRLQHCNLADYDFRWIFVDPPRAGLDKDTEAMVQRFDNILYISCNPDTLIENLQTLGQTHRIQRAAFFDQFPYTDHMEAGVLLTRK